jgi:hypothetical protein
VFAAAFNFPTASRQEFFQSGIVSWVGVLFCLAGLVLAFSQSCFLWEEYVAFGIVLLGQFFGQACVAPGHPGPSRLVRRDDMEKASRYLAAPRAFRSLVPSIGIPDEGKWFIAQGRPIDGGIMEFMATQ